MIADPFYALLDDCLRESALRMDAAGIPRLMRELCPQCSGSGRCATSTWEHPQMHVERCTCCAGSGHVTRQVSP